MSFLKLIGCKQTIINDFSYLKRISI